VKVASAFCPCVSTCARWAAAACRLIRLAVAPAPAAARPAPFWVPLASALLSAGPGGPSALSLCGARLQDAPADGLPSLAADPLRSGLPPPLHRLACGLASQPLPTDVRGSLAPGPWCCNCPLWGNPLLLLNGRTLEHTAPGRLILQFLPSPPHTVRELCQANTRWLGWLQDAGRHIRGDAEEDICDAVAACEWLRDQLPDGWKDQVVHAVLHPNPPPPARAAVEAMLVARLGWNVPGVVEPITFRTLTVRLATRLQLQPVAEYRAALHAAYVAEALGGVGDPNGAAQAFRATLSRVWRLRWYNSHKETLWRLAVDGVGQLGSSHIPQAPPSACACGLDVRGSPRLHAFWDCSAAAAVLGVLLPVLGTVSRAELWLLQCPEEVQQPVWDVVALAALSSMEVGRRRLRGGVAPALVHAQLAGDFWGRLRSFVAMGRAPASWAGVPPSHPFLGRSPDGSLALNRSRSVLLARAHVS
jgi:hypothetical protein